MTHSKSGELFGELLKSVLICYCKIEGCETVHHHLTPTSPAEAPSRSVGGLRHRQLAFQSNLVGELRAPVPEHFGAGTRARPDHALLAIAPLRSDGELRRISSKKVRELYRHGNFVRRCRRPWRRNFDEANPFALVALHLQNG